MTIYRKCNKCGHKKLHKRQYFRSGQRITPVVICPKCKKRSFVMRID